MPPLEEATNYLQPVFGQAQQAIQAQTPAIQNLYTALIQGLQSQAGAQAQDVVASATRRGVARPMLLGDVQSQLGQELALQTGQLGFQQAQDLSGVQQQVGKLGVTRGGSIFDLAKSLQENAISGSKAHVDREKIERDYMLKNREVERDFQVRQVAAARAEALAAAKAAQKKESLTASQALLTVGQLWQPGQDGYVNPKQWNELRRAFMEAGYSGSAFAAEFGTLVNPEHQYRDSKLPRYAGVGLKD